MLAILIAAVALQLIPVASSSVTYERSAVGAGQWWRLATFQLTHWSWKQLGWDALVFAVLGGLCEQRCRRDFLLCVGLSALAIPAAVWLARPDIEGFRGLSGIDSALFVLFATRLAWQRARQSGWPAAAPAAATLLAFAAKTAYEFARGTTLFVQDTTGMFEPIPLAHTVGAAAGMVTLVLTSVFSARSCRSLIA